MRLNQTTRDQFVNAVMRDFPDSPFQDQAHARYLAASHAALREAGIDPDVFEKIIALDFAKRAEVYVVGFGYLPGRQSETPEMGDLKQAEADEQSKRQDVKRQVRALAYGCTTLKQLREAAPDLAKYLPAETSAKVDRTVPVVRVDIMGVLKAAGWGQ